MILHIAPDYINKPLYQNLLEALALHDIAVKQYVYACDNAKHEMQAVPDNVHIVNRSFSAIERLLFFPKQQYLLRDIESVVPLKDVKIIHAHTLFSSGYMAYRLYQKYGIPYIVAVRNTDVNVFFKYMQHLRPIGRKIAKDAQKIIFISPAYKNQVLRTYLPQEFERKVVVIPNGIDPLFLENTSHHSMSEEIRLIYVGRMEKAKNVHTIIKVADSLRQEDIKVKLCLVGSLLCPEYKELIEARKDYIEWHDQCSKEEVLKYMRENDIFIMPSYKETFGLVYAEAMSQGLPVIYTKGQGFDGFFKEGEVGYDVMPDDIVDIKDKIKRIIQNYDTISLRCQQYASMFDWKNIAVEYNTIYQTI